MHLSISRRLRSAACLAGLMAGFAPAQSVDFEAPEYVAEKTLIGADGWVLSSESQSANADNFTIQSGAEGKWVHALSSGSTAIYRPFPSQSGILDVRWKWRAMNPGVGLCLGVSGPASGVRASTRALACLDPSGVVTSKGNGTVPTPTAEIWKAGAWLFMRMVLDNSSGVNKFTLYATEDSLRGSERALAAGIPMDGTGEFTRIALRDEGGSGFVDIDDLSWEATVQWTGASASDSNWSNASNWKPNQVPDSATHVLFSDNASSRGSQLGKTMSVRSITVANGYKGTLNLGGQTLDISGKADFTGGAYTGGGSIRLSAAGGQCVMAPASGKALPTLIHDAAGLVRLNGRALIIENLQQTRGTLDFNGYDLMVVRNLAIKNGLPGTLRNLAGRNLSAGLSARFEGVSKDSLLGLNAPAPGWTISVSVPDSLIARFASLGGSRTTAASGYAYQCTEANGNNIGWIFAVAPAIVAPPHDTEVNVSAAATFRISVSSKLPVNCQWFRDEKEIPGAADSAYTLPQVKRADSGATFTCRVSNAAGSVTSPAARLKVGFPPPTVSLPPQEFGDSLSLKIISAVAGAKVWHSRNGSAFQETVGILVLKDSSTLKAFAVLGPDTSTTVTWTFPKSALTRVSEPTISPELSSFGDSVTVVIAAGPEGGSIFYTLDQTDPDSTRTRYTAPFVLRSSTTVSAIAYKAGYRQSGIRTRIFIRKETAAIPLPQAKPAGGSFDDSIVVELLPPALLPNAAIYYLLGAKGPFRYESPLVLRESTVLKAISISGSLYSDTAAWTFKRRLEAPAATPKGRVFADSLAISLSTKLAGASILYTWDGTEPGPGSSVYPGRPLLLDSTAVLKAVAVLGKDTSVVLSESYQLVPSAPLVSPRGGDYSSRISIALSASNAKARIYYTLDGTAPGPERGLPAYSAPISLDTSATLKAMAISGQGAQILRGPLLIENYTFINPGARVLGPGQRLDLSASYNLVSPAGAAPLDVAVLPADSLRNLVKGFRDILFGIRLSQPAAPAVFPNVIFAAPGGEPRSLFSLAPDSTVRFLTSSDTALISVAGVYFLAVDTLAPIITYSGESFTAGDTTRLAVSIKDNVANLTLDLERSDYPAGNFQGREIASPLYLSVSLKNSSGSLAPLTLRLKADDHSLKSVFPANGSAFAVAQKSSIPVASPALFSIGKRAEEPWDFIAVPLALNPPLTLSQLRKNNSAPGLEGAAYNTAAGKYRSLSENEPLPVGAAIWLAASSGLDALVFPTLQTVPRREESYKLTLHHGWNQVANPSLNLLYWPVTRTIPEVYQLSPLKGLHAYDAKAGRLVHAEALESWRGYYAYYFGSRDTTIELLYQPPSPPAQAPPRNTGALAKGGAAAERGSASLAGFSFRLNLGSGLSVNLGTSIAAGDGIGAEDEPGPPARDNAGPLLYSARGPFRLESDYIHFTPGSTLAWTIVAGLPVRAGDANTGDSSAFRSAVPEGLALPQGHRAWAVSRRRGIRFPLDRGEGIPLHPGFTDTLEVMVGPAGELDAALASVPEAVDAFSAKVSAAAGGFALRLSLPAAARLRWTLRNLNGFAVESGALDLPEGIFHVAGNGRGRGYPPGMYVLTLDWTGKTGAGKTGAGKAVSGWAGSSKVGAGAGRLSRKIAITRDF